MHSFAKFDSRTGKGTVRGRYSGIGIEIEIEIEGENGARVT